MILCSGIGKSAHNVLVIELNKVQFVTGSFRGVILYDGLIRPSHNSTEPHRGLKLQVSYPVFYLGSSHNVLVTEPHKVKFVSSRYI